MLINEAGHSLSSELVLKAENKTLEKIKVISCIAAGVFPLLGMFICFIPLMYQPLPNSAGFIVPLTLGAGLMMGGIFGSAGLAQHMSTKISDNHKKLSVIYQAKQAAIP